MLIIFFGKREVCSGPVNCPMSEYVCEFGYVVPDGSVAGTVWSFKLKLLSHLYIRQVSYILISTEYSSSGDTWVC